MERALVTGGAGFIGSHLVRELIERKVQVRVLDSLVTGNRANWGELGEQVEFYENDILDPGACQNACENVDAVFHLAALISVQQSIEAPDRADNINTGGTLNMLLAARDQKVKRFVFSSSAAVYGNTEVVPTPEETLPMPLSPYGIQKLTGEHYARNFFLLYGLETVCLRYFNVYGPRQNPQSEYAAVIPKFITRLLAGEPVTVFGDGEQTRDFCSVQDVVAANLLAAETTHFAALGNVCNIANGTQTSLNQLLAQLGQLLGQELQVNYTEARSGDIRHSSADIQRARTNLGYTPQVTLETGLQQTLEYYQTT